MQIVLDGKIKTDGAVIALGMFDGVHLGHRVLLKRAKALAHRAKMPMVVCTFVRHPLELIAPERAPALLTTFEERASLLEELGTDILNAMPFDRDIMNQPPECYIGELIRRFHPTDIVCGYNHSFGSRGSGSPELLHALGAELNFRTSVVPQITLNGQPVSSTAVREALAQGRVHSARQMLLRPYARLAVLAEQDGDKSRFVLPPNGKQNVADGKYRALLHVGERAYPTVLSIVRAETAECFLPGGSALMKPGDEAGIGFLSPARA